MHAFEDEWPQQRAREACMARSLGGGGRGRGLGGRRGRGRSSGGRGSSGSRLVGQVVQPSRQLCLQRLLVGERRSYLGCRLLAAHLRASGKAGVRGGRQKGLTGGLASGVAPSQAAYRQ